MYCLRVSNIFFSCLSFGDLPSGGLSLSSLGTPLFVVDYLLVSKFTPFAASPFFVTAYTEVTMIRVLTQTKEEQQVHQTTSATTALFQWTQKIPEAAIIRWAYVSLSTNSYQPIHPGRGENRD